MLLTVTNNTRPPETCKTTVTSKRRATWSRSCPPVPTDSGPAYPWSAPNGRVWTHPGGDGRGSRVGSSVGWGPALSAWHPISRILPACLWRGTHWPDCSQTDSWTWPLCWVQLLTYGEIVTLRFIRCQFSTWFKHLQQYLGKYTVIFIHCM